MAPALPRTEPVPLFTANHEFLRDVQLPIQPGPRAPRIVHRCRIYEVNAHGFYVERPELADATLIGPAVIAPQPQP